MSGFIRTYGAACFFFAVGIYNIVTCVAAYLRTGDSNYFFGIIVGFLWIGGGTLFAVWGRRRRAGNEEQTATIPGSAWRFLLNSRIKRQWLAILAVIVLCMILGALALSVRHDLRQLGSIKLAAGLTARFLIVYVPSGLIALGIYVFRKLSKSLYGYPHFLHGAIAIAEACLLYFGGMRH